MEAQVNYDYSAFDMAGAIVWYLKNFDVLSTKLSKFYHTQTKSVLSFEFENQSFLYHPDVLTLITGIFNSFPKASRDRSTLKKIIFKPATWFKKGMDPANPEITTNPEEAISLTHFVPGYCDGTRLLTKKESDIWLYKLPNDICVPEAKIILEIIVMAQTFAHEFAETLLDPVFHFADYMLKLPNGQIVSGLEFIKKLIQVVEKYPPISEYASINRDKNGKFRKNPKSKVEVECSEDLAENFAACLGFAYQGNGQGTLDPFLDRPDVEKWIENFLNAERIM